MLDRFKVHLFQRKNVVQVCRLFCLDGRTLVFIQRGFAFCCFFISKDVSNADLTVYSHKFIMKAIYKLPVVIISLLHCDNEPRKIKISGWIFAQVSISYKTLLTMFVKPAACKKIQVVIIISLKYIIRVWDSFISSSIISEWLVYLDISEALEMKLLN